MWPNICTSGDGMGWEEFLREPAWSEGEILPETRCDGNEMCIMGGDGYALLDDDDDDGMICVPLQLSLTASTQKLRLIAVKQNEILRKSFLSHCGGPEYCGGNSYKHCCDWLG